MEELDFFELPPQRLCKKCGACHGAVKKGNFPQSPWDKVPSGCGYEGWLFQKQEEIKQKVRKQKEDILSLQTLFAQARTPEESEKLSQVIENIKNSIKMYEQFGSEDW